MPNQEQFEILIIGSGESGKWLAWTMAGAGKRTAVVERRLIGGSCPNIACLPSKNVIHSAKIADFTRHAADFGIRTGEVSVAMEGVRTRKRRMVHSEIQFHLDRYRSTGTELILGEARFVGPKTVEVRMNDGGTRVLTGDQVCLNVGSRAALPDVPGLRAAMPLTHIEALELDRVPEHLIIVGGGFVGLEFAQAMRRFGSKVTILARGAQLADREDPDVAEAILTLFRDEGIEVMFHAELKEVQGRSGQGVRAHVTSPQGERVLEGSDILTAVGRLPNTDSLGLEKAGVELDQRGYIRVNDRLQTTAPGIWAMGDCNGGPHFTHVAFDDFRIVRDNLAGGNRSTRGRLIPFCLFTDPELARVGLSESEAKKLGRPYRLARVPMEAVLRTHTLGETRGFMKALISADTDEILGFTAFGTQAGEMMAVVQTAMLAKLPYTAVRDAIFAHPTMAEGLTPLFNSTPGRLSARA